MTKEALMQMLNEINAGLKTALTRVNELVAENKALKEALAQPEQEPVALVLAERERIKAANAPEIERINTYIKKLEDCIRARGNT